jgi:hypothetical protein
MPAGEPHSTVVPATVLHIHAIDMVAEAVRCSRWPSHTCPGISPSAALSRARATPRKRADRRVFKRGNVFDAYGLGPAPASTTGIIDGLGRSLCEPGHSVPLRIVASFMPAIAAAYRRAALMRAAASSAGSVHPAAFSSVEAWSTETRLPGWACEMGYRGWSLRLACR